MAFFKEIEGEGAVVVERGVYKQVKLYERDGYLYVQVAGGFTRLMADGSTSKMGGSLRLDYMSWGDTPLYKDQFGRLRLPPTGEIAGVTRITDTSKLLGAPQ